MLLLLLLAAAVSGASPSVKAWQPSAAQPLLTLLPRVLVLLLLALRHQDPLLRWVLQLP
jgi:hypothetical protein